MGNHQLFCFLALQAVPGLHMYFSARKVPKAALIAMQRPTPRCARLAIRLIVLARLRTSADTTALLRKEQADL